MINVRDKQVATTKDGEHGAPRSKTGRSTGCCRSAREMEAMSHGRYYREGDERNSSVETHRVRLLIFLVVATIYDQRIAFSENL